MSWSIDERTRCVVTGGSAGIGRETALGLARLGAWVTIVGRNPQRTPDVASQLARATGNARVDHVLADFSCLAEVRAGAAAIASRHPRIDVLVNNAGAWHPQPRLSRDGYEDTFAVNHLAHFVLTRALWDRFSAPGRIVHVSSGMHRLARSLPLLADILRRPRFDPFGFVSYGRSKLCNLLFSLALTRRLPAGVVSHTVHPGAVGTDVARDMWLARNGVKLVMPLLKTPEQGAVTTLHVISDPHLGTVTGRYFVDGREEVPSAAARDVDAAERLWAFSEEIADASARVAADAF